MKLGTLIKKNKFIFIFLFSLISFTLLSADSGGGVRSFDEKAMDSYSESADFSYMNLVIQPPSIWQRIQWWFQSILQKIFSNPNAPIFTELLFYGILFLILGGAIFYIVRLKYVGAVATDAKNFTASISSLENAKVDDFEGMIAGAIKDKNYKLAIRYVYLKSLTLLSQRGLIKLKDWKSPFDYEKELNKELVAPYKDLSRLFEYVWYGDFEAGEKEYLRSNDLSEKMSEG